MTSSEFINKFKSKYLWGNIGAMILIVAALCLCLMAVGRDSVYIDGTFVQHSGDSAEAFLRPEAQTEKAAL